MTVPSEVYLAEYDGNDVTLAFVISFGFSSNSDIQVAKRAASGNVTILTSGYTISGEGTGSGTCTMAAAPATGETLILSQNPEMLQEVDYVSNDKFPAETHEGALDRQTRISHRLYEAIQRSLRVPFGDAGAGDDMMLPQKSARLGMLLRFNDTTGLPEMAASIGTTVLSQSVIAALLSPQTTAPSMLSPNAESTLGVTPVRFSFSTGQLDRYTASIGAGITSLTATYLPLLEVKPYVNVMDFIPATEHAAILDYSSTTDLLTYEQRAINYAALSGKMVVQYPAGMFQHSAALRLNYDVALNPNFPTDSFKQGRVTLRGVGTMDVAGWTNRASGGYRGTVLRCTGTGDALAAEDQTGAFPLRNIRLDEMTIAGNGTAATGFVLSLKGANTRVSLGRLFLVQENAAGSGLEMEDCFLTDCEDVWCYQDDELGLGAGARVRNVGTSGGDLGGKHFTVRGWKGSTLAAGTTITAVTLANECQVTAVAHGLVTGDVAYISAVGGTTQLNTKYFSVERVDADNVKLRGVNSAAMTAYTSGGSIQKATAYGKGIVFGHETYGSGTNINTLSFDILQAKDNIIGIEIGHGVSSFRAYVHVEGSLLAGAWLRNNPDTVELSGYFSNANAGMGDIIIGDSALAGVAREWNNVKLGPLKHASVGYGCAIKVDFIGTSSGALSIENISGAPANSGFSKGISFPTGTTRHGIDLRALALSANFGIAVENYAQVEQYIGDSFTYFGQLIELNHRLKLTGVISPAAIGSAQNDYNPTSMNTAAVLRLSSSGASRNITGMVASGEGDIKLIENVGSQDIVLKDEDAASSAANRFALKADITINPDGTVALRYDATSLRWRPFGGVH